MENIEQYQGSVSNSKNFISNEILKMRLGGTEELIQEIEVFLSGKRINYLADEEGGIKRVTTEISEPKATPEGIFTILTLIRSILNPHIAQGNFIMDTPNHSTIYERYVRDKRIDITYLLILNMYKWDIKDKDISGIIDFIMGMIEPFLTRLIDNKERESYAETLKYVETQKAPEQKAGILNSFFKR